MGMIPQAINRFNVYQGGKKLIGISGEVTLPEVTYLTDSLEGAGVGGNMDLPIIGLVDDMEAEIPFMSLVDDVFSMMDPTEPADVSLNGSIQGTNRETGKVDYISLSVAFRGIVKKFAPGTVKAGGKMGSSVTLGLSYYKIVLNGKTQLEIDKLNEVFIVNGHDVIEKVRNMC